MFFLAFPNFTNRLFITPLAFLSRPKKPASAPAKGQAPSRLDDAPQWADGVLDGAFGWRDMIKQAGEIHRCAQKYLLAEHNNGIPRNLSFVSDIFNIKIVRKIELTAVISKGPFKYYVNMFLAFFHHTHPPCKQIQ